jgi:hypothetical protein
MCLPGVDSSTSPETFVGIAGAYMWAKAFEPLGPVGVYLSQALQASSNASGNDWIARPTFESTQVELTFESGNTLTMNAADMDSAVLAAYGYSYNSVDGVISTRGYFDDTTGLPSGPKWTLKDGMLARPSTTSVTGEVVGNVALEIAPGALALAGSASLLTNHAFDGLVPDAPDGRLATGEIWVKGGFFDDSGRSWTTLNLVSPAGDLIESRGWPTDEFPAGSKATAGAPSGQSAASSASSSFANELAEEHARSYAASVAQADTAQQSEYTANQAAKDAASWARIDQNMSQSGTASASGARGPAGGAAPGQGAGNMLANGPLPGAASGGGGGGGGGGATTDGSGGGEGAGAGESGYEAPDHRPIIPVRSDWRQNPVDPSATGTDRQGTFKDGRWVPNYFKAINQDLWTGWGKSSGAEAVLTFPFVLAMSGAIFLPQAVNDIPNIPTLLMTSLNDLAYGDYAKSLEAGGDALGAIGMAGELVEGVAALRSAEEAVTTFDAGVSKPSRPGGVRPTVYNSNLFGRPSWSVKNLRPHPDVVVQSAQSSCNAAGAQMVAKAAGIDKFVNESAILSYLRTSRNEPRIATGLGGIDSREVVEAANFLDPGAGSSGELSWATDARLPGNILNEIDRIGANGPWVAEIETTEAYHSVTVLGIDSFGDVSVLDPAGYAYEMTVAEFENVWNGSYIARR